MLGDEVAMLFCQSEEEWGMRRVMRHAGEVGLPEIVDFGLLDLFEKGVHAVLRIRINLSRRMAGRFGLILRVIGWGLFMVFKMGWSLRRKLVSFMRTRSSSGIKRSP